MAKFLDGTGLSDIITKIKNAFVAKADTTAVTSIGIDSTPTANSTNLVTSGGVKNAITQLENELIDTELVYSNAINDLSQNKADVSHTHNVEELKRTVYDSESIDGFLPNVFYNLGTVTGSVA